MKELVQHKLTDHLSCVTSLEWVPDSDKLVPVTRRLAGCST